MNNDLKRAVALANHLLDIRKQIEQAEILLSDLKQQETKVEQEDLPELMQELELTSFKLDNGANVEVKPDITCGITEANRAAAHAWLTENGYGALIKSEVKVAFEAGQIDAAAQFAAENSGNLKEFVHPITLKSFLKERLEAGENFPQEAFSLRAFNRAKIEMPKVKKAPKVVAAPPAPPAKAAKGKALPPGSKAKVNRFR